MVPLGNSGVEVTRLGFGCGTFNGMIQADLGQEGFTRLVRHAYDQGIRFFETAESYVTPRMLGAALKGLPRDSYKLMTKWSTEGSWGMEDPQTKLDRCRTHLNTDYFDIVLIHCVRSPRWPEETRRFQDALSETKQQKIVLAHGASVHGLPALATFPGNRWLEIAMIRMNHAGVKMDTADTGGTNQLGDVKRVVEHTTKVHAQGTGVISMKLVGEGQFAEARDREEAMRFTMGLGIVDCVSVAYKSVEEVDETIDRVNRVLTA